MAKKKMILTVEVEYHDDQMDHVTAIKPRTEIDWDDLITGEHVGWIVSGKVLHAREIDPGKEPQEKEEGNNIVIVVEGGVVQSVGHDIKELDHLPGISVDILDFDSDEESSGYDVTAQVNEYEKNGLIWLL